MSSSVLASSSLDDVLSAELVTLRAQNLERRLRPVSHRRGALVETERGLAVDFSSNDYLGLASDPRLAQAAAEATAIDGSGATASRLIAGDTDAHERLDRAVAQYFGTDAALTFATGYAANTGIIPALVGRDDLIVADELNHASLIDGCRLSRATLRVYAHGDMAALADVLARKRKSYRRALLVTDGMFSMDGDTAPLDALAEIARRYDAWTYVDDAHAVGVSGANGRGTIERFPGLAIDVLVGTMGKAFGSAGAFVVGSPTLRAYLINRARTFIFSTGPMPGQAAAAQAALEIAKSEPALRDRVRSNARYLREAFFARGIPVIGEAESHIVPILIGDAGRMMAAGASLAEQGFLVGAVRPPTVPAGTCRLRVTVSAAHTIEQIDALAIALRATLSET